ncbi:MAG TPA: HD domain-containing phosphohydrolase [Terriglobales bacterium]|nr:HD domain-containing phosphohydrolase [Terriglobales bacterium]
MAASTQPDSAAIAKPHPAPAVVYFSADRVAEKATSGMHAFRRVELESLDGRPANGGRLARGAERVVIASSEWLVAHAADTLRAPNIRVIALADRRFHDPRIDALVYAYLPLNTPLELLERMVGNALEHMNLLDTREKLGERLALAAHEIQELNQIGAALSAEHDTEALLEMILTRMRAITAADAGSLYLAEPIPTLLPQDQSERRKRVRRRLRFKLAQNDSVELKFRETLMEVNERSIAGYVAKTGEGVNLEDAYHVPSEMPFTFNRQFDEDSGYRTKSILAIPMKDQQGEVVGVVQLINAKRKPELRLDSVTTVAAQVAPFSRHQQAIAESLASQAAVALENSLLYQAIQNLFEGFVKASVTAIEARDPTTSGHSFRVANLTVALAEAVDRADFGPYAGLHFSRVQMREIRYASLLHDFGKVGVREEVLVKAKKLYPSQLELIRQRFRYVRKAVEAEALLSKLDCVLAQGREEFLKRLPEFDALVAERVAVLDGELKAIVEANEPLLNRGGGGFEKLLEIAAQQYTDADGQRRNLLTEDEIRLLSIPKGSLDESERLQIESHVVHTFNFLQQIPWTSGLQNLPAIARSHHEKLNGTGYPRRLTAPDIPVQTRMMTISDIFDALGAADRPYKRSVALDRSLEILTGFVEHGELDADLFRIFLDSKVYERWKVEPVAY